MLRTKKRLEWAVLTAIATAAAWFIFKGMTYYLEPFTTQLEGWHLIIIGLGFTFILTRMGIFRKIKRLGK